MVTAIYARKSTEQRGDAESKSVARQLADARAFAHRMHFPAIGDQHVYTDDAVSGADVKNLRARARLISDVEAGRINTIIMADMSRFSRRDGAEVLIELKQIARKATIWFYETGQPYNPGDDLGSRAGNFIQAESNRDYRLKIRVKTIAALKRKAALGHVVTRPCYGYKNVPVCSQPAVLAAVEWGGVRRKPRNSGTQEYHHSSRKMPALVLLGKVAPIEIRSGVPEQF
jgi:DNA invertase Pin-like site-specific DNA recombinase